jgi:hypothetical protein
MLAVLKDALLNYRKQLRNPKKSLRRDREWFFANDDDGLFSFESVCAVLGLDPQRIRKRLRLWERKRQPDRTRIRSKTPTTSLLRCRRRLEQRRKLPKVVRIQVGYGAMIHSTGREAC